MSFRASTSPSIPPHTLPSPIHSLLDHPAPSPSLHPLSQMKSVLASSWQVLEQPPPPSLRDILGAYKARGDGDRDMLMAMLNAKSAEDQRLANVAALHRTMLELHHNYSIAPPPPQHVPMESGGSRHYSPPFSQSPPLRDHKPLRANGRSPGSRSPTYVPQLPSMRDTPPHPSTSQPPRKRHRSSRSPSPPHRGEYESQSNGRYSHELPPSPSESSRSDSAEYSPRSRTSMAIGSLLSSGPTREVNGDDPHMSDKSAHNKICVTSLPPTLSC